MINSLPPNVPLDVAQQRLLGASCLRHSVSSERFALKGEKPSPQQSQQRRPPRPYFPAEEADTPAACPLLRPAAEPLDETAAARPAEALSNNDDRCCRNLASSRSLFCVSDKPLPSCAGLVATEAFLWVLWGRP